MVSELEQNGFEVVDLLNKQDVETLNALIAEYLPHQGSDFVSSSHFLSEKDSKYINEQLHKVVKPVTDVLFPELELLGGTLATKIKGKSILKAHNDWSIVDESRYNSYNLWIALVDTDEQNGTLGLIPGSHLWDSTPRGMGIPGVYEVHTAAFLRAGYEPPLQAGQAILYNHRLVHYSRPNISAKPRNVAIIGMKDRNADLCVSVCFDNATIQTYAARQEDFYVFDANKIRANNKLIATCAVSKNKVSWPVLQALYTKHVPPVFDYLPRRKMSFLEKLYSLFHTGT